MPSRQYIQHLQKLLVHFKRHGGVHRPPGCTAIDLFDEEDITCWFVQLVYQDDEGIDFYVALRMLFAEDAEPERSASPSHPPRTLQCGNAAAEDISEEDGAAARHHSLHGRVHRRGCGALLIPRRMPLVFVISPRLTASFIHHGAICSQELMSQQWEQTPENIELLIAALHTTLHPFCKDSCVSVSAVDPSNRMVGGGGALRSGTVAALPLVSSYSASEHHDGIRLIQLAHPYQFRTFVAADETAAPTEGNDGLPTATLTAVPAMRHGSGEEAGTFVCSASPLAPRCSPTLPQDEDRLSGLPDDGHTIRHVQDLQAVLHHTSTTTRTAIFSTVGILADAEAIHRPLASLPSDVSPPHASSAQRTSNPPADSDGVRIVHARTSPDGKPQVIVTLRLPHRPPIATGTHTTHIKGDLPLLRMTSSSPQQLLHSAMGRLHVIENTASQLQGGDAEQLGFLLAPPVPSPPSSLPEASGDASSYVVRTDIPSWCALHLSDMYIYGHLRVFGKVILERCVFIGSIAAEERGSVTMRTSLMGVAIENTLWRDVSNVGMSAIRTDFSPTANQAARDGDDWPPRQQEGILALDSAVIGISGGSVVTRVPPLPTAAASSPSDEPSPITATPVTAGGRRVTEPSLRARLLANRDVHHRDGGLPTSRATAPPLRALILVSNTAKLAIVSSRIDPGEGCERTIFAEQSAMVDILHSVLIAGDNCALSVQGCEAYCEGVLTSGVSDVGGSHYGICSSHARKQLCVSDTDRVKGFNVEFGGTLTARDCTVDAVYFGFSVLAHSVAHLYRCHAMRVVNGYTIDASTASLENCTGRAHHVGVFAVHQAKVVFTHDGDKDYDERCRAVASCWQESLRLEQQDAGGGGADNCQGEVKTSQHQLQSPLLHEFQGISSPSQGDNSSHHTVEEIRVPATELSHGSESRLARSASPLPFAEASDSHPDTRKPCAGSVLQAPDGYHGRGNVIGSSQQLDDNERDDGEAEDNTHNGDPFARRVVRLTRRAQSIYKRTVLAGSSNGPQHQPRHPPDSARHTVAAGCCGCLEGGRYNLEARNASVRAVGITFLSPWDTCVSAYEGSRLELVDCILWSHHIPLLDARNHSTNASEAQRTPKNDDQSHDGSTNRMQEHAVGKAWCGSGGGSANVLTNGVKLITSVADIMRCLCINLYFSYALLHHSVASFSECYAVGGVNGFTVDRSRATLMHCGTDTRQVGVYALQGATIELCGTEHRVGSGERTETSPPPPLRIAGGFLAVYMGGEYGIEVHGSTATGRGVTVRRGQDSCINVYGGSTVHLSRSLVDASAEDAAHSLVCRSGATSALHRRPHGNNGFSQFPSEPDVESPSSTNSLTPEAKRGTARPVALDAILWCSPHGFVAPGSKIDVGPGQQRPTVGIKVWSASSCHVSDSEVRCVIFGMAAIGPETSLEAHHCTAKHVVNGYAVETARMLLSKCSANSSGIAILALSHGQCIIHRGSYTSKNCGLESRGATVQIRGAVKLYGFAVAGVWIHDGAHIETEVDGRLDVQATKPISSSTIGRAPCHAPPHHHTHGGTSLLHQEMLLPFTPTGAVCLLVERAAAIIHQSNLGGGASCGLSCGNGGRVHLNRSAFYDCAHVGVRVLDGGQVFLMDCIVACTGRYALLVEEGGQLQYADDATTTPTTRSPSPHMSALENGTAAASVRPSGIPSGTVVSASSVIRQLRGLAQRFTGIPLWGRREPGPPSATPVRGTAGTATADAHLRHRLRSTAHSRQSGSAPSEEDQSIMNRLLRKADRLRRHGRTAALTGAVMVRGGICSIQGATLCPSTIAEDATCAITTVSRLSPSGLPAAPPPMATVPAGSVGCHGHPHAESHETSRSQGSTALLAADVSRPVKASTTTPARGGGRGDLHGTHTAELTNDACLTVRTGGMLIVKQCIIELPPALANELHQQREHWVDVSACASEGDADRSVRVSDANPQPVTIFRSGGVGAVLRVAHTFLMPPGTLDTAADRTASRLLDEALAQTLQPGSTAINATSDGERGAAGGCSRSAANDDAELPSSSLGDCTDEPARCQLVEVVDRAEASLRLVSSASALPPHAPSSFPTTAVSAGAEGESRPALSSAPWLPGIRACSDEDGKMLTTVPQGWRSMQVSIRVHDAANCRLDTCNVHRLVIAGSGSRVEVRSCLLTGPMPLLRISQGASVQIAESVLLGLYGAPMTGSVHPDADLVPQSREAALLLAQDANVWMEEVSVVVIGRRPVLRLCGRARLTAPGMKLSVRRVAPPLTGSYHDSASVSAASRERRTPQEATDSGEITIADSHASPAAGSDPAGCLDRSFPVVLTGNDAEVRTAWGGVDPSMGGASEVQRGRVPSLTPHQALVVGSLCGLVAAAAFAARLGRRTVRS